MWGILLEFKAHLHHTKEKTVAVIRINKAAFLRKIKTDVTPNLRRGLAALATTEAHWGIKGHDDLPLIMGVLNFGDPAHTVPNRKKNSPERKNMESFLAGGGKNNSAIPPRPWLSRSTEGYYYKKLINYVNTNLPKVIAGIPKRGRGQSHTSPKIERAWSIEKFMKGFAELGAENAKKSWELANFTPNRPMTLKNKTDPRPLHDTGVMNESVIEGWLS